MYITTIYFTHYNDMQIRSSNFKHTSFQHYTYQLLYIYSIPRDDGLQMCPKRVRGGADNSLARPGRKQTTATKHGIYSTCSPRSSIHFLARCSNFCRPLKNIQKVFRPTRSPRQQWPPRLAKNVDLSIVFLVQGTGGSPTGPDPENRVGD